MSLVESLVEVKIPIYGIVDRPLDLSLHSHFLSTGCEASIILMFTSPRYPPCPFSNSVRTFRIGTSNLDVDHYSMLEMMIQDQVQPVRNPFLWEGTIILGGIPFRSTIKYYASPFKMSGFNLKSEKEFLSGLSYGPSCDEVIELLEGLQVINERPDVLKQYEASC